MTLMLTNAQADELSARVRRYARLTLLALASASVSAACPAGHLVPKD